MTTALARFAERIAAARQSIATRPAPAPQRVEAPPSEGSLGDHPLADRGAASKYRVTAAIPAGARVAGDLVLEESVVLGGTVDGALRISGAGMAAFVKKGAVARGGIKASIVLVYGEVFGLVEAEYVRVYAGGRIEGQVHAEALCVDRGGLLINDHMRVAPPISGAGRAPIDAKPVLRPASALDAQGLMDAVASIRRG